MNRIKSSRKTGFVIIVFIYVAALIPGILVFNYFDNYNFLLRILLADIVGTILVWLSGVILKNSSVYDPYWSVAPMAIMFLYAVYTGQRFSTGTYIVLFAVFAWGIRLTLNWAYTFENLKSQDWRYDFYKSSFPSLWQFINFTGINMMPTLIVFGVMMPGILVIHNRFEANFLTYFFLIICLMAVGMQTVSDIQMHNFKKNRLTDISICRNGLWRYCRHPNYAGEILMWWGIYGMLLSFDFSYYVTGIGALLNTLMFVFISVPLMEKKLIKNKPGYEDYKYSTGMFFPLPKELSERSRIVRKLISSINGKS